MAKLLTGTRVYGTANVDNVLTVGNVTPVNSTSNTTGSLVVTGGAGITGNVHVGNVIITGATSNGITFADGTRQTTAATGGGGASPSGYLANTIIVANSTGFLSNSNAFFTESNSTIIFGRSSPVVIQNTTSSVDTTTGALIVSGGLGVAGSISTPSVRFGAGTLQSTSMTFGTGNYSGANWTSVYDPASYGGIKTSTSSHSLVGGGLNNGTLWFNQFVSPTITSVNAPTNGNVATVLIGSPIINAANTFLANVVPYSLWANGSIYTANNITVANNVSSNNIRAQATLTVGPISSPSQTGAPSIAHFSGGNIKIDADKSIVWDGTFPTQIKGSSGSGSSSYVEINPGNDGTPFRIDNGGITKVQIATQAGSNTTGALIVTGGASIRRNLYSGSIFLTGSGNGVTFVDGTMQTTAGSSVANTIYLQGVNDGQNSRMFIIEGTDATQNTNIANKLSLSGAASQTVTGNVVFGNDVTVAGNLIVLGNTLSLNVSSLEVEDTLIQLGIGNYTTDVLSIGYVGHYNDGTNAHAGFIRDAITKEFYAFQGYTPETTGNVININAASFNKANIQGNWFKGNLIATTARVGGLDVNNFVTASYNQANTGTVLAQAAYDQANVTIGVDASQNTAIAATDGKMQSGYNVANTADVQSTSSYFHANGAFIKANAAYDQANTGTVLAQAGFNQANVTISVDASQNVRLDFSNTAIAATDNKMQSAYDQANTGTVLAQAAFNQANTGGGGGASPSGYLANTIIVANSAGFLSNSNAFFTESNSTIIFGRSSPVVIQNTTSSGSTTTGALVVRGGVGISGDLRASGTVVGSQFTTISGGLYSGTYLMFNGVNNGGSNLNSEYNQVLVGGIKTASISLNDMTGGTGGVFWHNEFGGATFTRASVPITTSVATVLIRAPIVNVANSNLSRVEPYSLWANGSIYTANNVTVANSVIVSRGVEIVTSVLANNVVTPSASVVVNDITNQFDNLKCVFNLRSDQSNVVSILNSRNLEVIINGAKLAPYVGELRFPWLTPYDSFKGHRVVSSNTSSQVVIYNPPAPGDQAILTLINNSSSPQNRRYPYSAATIALGD
jgi:hypothetical protein